MENWSNSSAYRRSRTISSDPSFTLLASEVGQSEAMEPAWGIDFQIPAATNETTYLLRIKPHKTAEVKIWKTTFL